MSKVYEKHPGNLDVAALYGESLLVLKPWAMWVRDAESGKIVPASPSTLVAKDILEAVSVTRCTWFKLVLPGPSTVLPTAFPNLFAHESTVSRTPGDWW